jgi:sugar phosphate isomerase/epimerase
MCDWNLGPASEPDLIPKAAQANLEGLQVSVGTAPDRLPLRKRSVRDHYRELGEKHDIEYPSTAAGSILNQIPLKSEPQASVYVVEAIEAASALGAPTVLLAFFGNGDLRWRDEDGELETVSDEPFAEYRLDEEGVRRVVEALRQLAPRAEEAGVVLGLENTLTAEQNLELISEVGSPAVSVYYDTGNSAAYGYDVPGEIRRLGNDRICEMHLKDRASSVLGAGEGAVDFEAVADACADIGYDGWYVLETSGREGQFMEDTRANVAFAKTTFG